MKLRQRVTLTFESRTPCVVNIAHGTLRFRVSRKERVLALLSERQLKRYYVDRANSFRVPYEILNNLLIRIIHLQNKELKEVIQRSAFSKG